MTLRRSGTSLVPLTVFRRWVTPVDFVAVVMGVFAALGVLAVMAVLLTSGIGGIDILEAGKLERFAVPTVITTIVVVLAAFFCGGWVHGTLRGRDKHSRLGSRHHKGSEGGPSWSSL